jgi:hypothetical protein
MNIIEAIAEPKVFGSQFRDAESWTSWRVFLRALFGLPMDETQRALFAECTGRQEPNREGHSEAWLVCGRRSGKSFTLALIAIFLAGFRDWRPYLAPGEVGTVMILAADRRQARVIMRYCIGLLKAVPMLAQLIESETRETITLRNRIVIEIHTASFRSTRGYTLVAALCDELAFWTTDEYASEPDYEVLNALRPGLSTIPGAMLLCASSPYAKKGALFDAHVKHFGRDGDGVLVWQAPTRTMNPTVAQRVIDEAMEADSSNALAEYGAIFRQDLENFIAREAVLACMEPGIRERPPVAGIKYECFVDPSGGSVDPMTCAIGHSEGDTVVIDAEREVFAPFDPASVSKEFADLFRRYAIRQTNGDSYAAQWCAQAFEKAGISYKKSDLNRSGLYLNLLPVLNSKTVRLLDHPRSINQICALERSTRRGASDSIDHPRGQHDDRANAIAGLVHVLANARRHQGVQGWGCSGWGRGGWSVINGKTIYHRGHPRWAEQQAAQNVANGSAPCWIDFKALEPKPLAEGLIRRYGPPRIW